MHKSEETSILKAQGEPHHCVQSYLRRGYKEDGARLFSGCAVPGQEVPFEQQEVFLCCVDDRVLAQIVQRVWSILLGDLQKLSGCGPG